MSRVLVYGATGDQGLPLMRALLARGFKLRAATRDLNHFPSTDFPEVEPVHASFDEPESLNAACRGMDAIALNPPFTFDRAYANRIGTVVANTAVQAGVKKIAFNTSCFIADHDIGLSAHDGRRDIEHALERSGLDYAVIRSTVFMDNMLRPWSKPSIANRSVFAYPAGPTLRISWVCLDDVGAYMAAALANPAVKAHKFAIGGPEILVGDQVAERLTEALGRPITFKSLHPTEFARGMMKLVTGVDAEPVPNTIWDRMAQFYSWYNDQAQSPLTVDLSPALALLDVKPTLLIDWARRQNWSLS